MKLTKKSPRTGKLNTMELPCTEEQYNAGVVAYNKGALLQQAFSFLNAEQREFVKTGYTPEDWKAMFPEDEDDTYEELKFLSL